MNRETVAEASARVIQRLGDKAAADPWAAGQAIADELGLTAQPARAQSWLFVRTLAQVPVDVATRFDGVIVAGRIWRNGLARVLNRDREWFEAVRTAGTRIVLFDWMLEPGGWKPGLREAIAFAASVGAEAYCLNVEPRPARHPGERWEGKPREADLYARTARQLCEEHRMELWLTSWAKPSARQTFPIVELVRPAHVCIPQPYEVHHPGGPDYVADVLEEWASYGAKRIMLGRGLHELDRSDNDAVRTPAEIAEHRESTPAGMAEVWWPPGVNLGRYPQVIDAAVS